MTRRLLRMLPRTATVTLVPLLASGCFLGPGQTDQGTDIVSQLQIKIPESATDITGHTDSGVDFLVPNDQWREYIAEYYPNATMSEFPARENDGTAPLVCIPALRSGVKLVQHVTGGEITLDGSTRTTRRAVLVTPSCKDGMALVQWVLRDPE